MAVAGKQRSGKNARVTVGGTALKHAEWEAENKADDLDTTNFESGGVEQGTTGIEVVDVSAKGDWDAGGNFQDSPPGIYPRDDLSTVKFYTNVTDNVFWAFPLLRVLSARNGAQVRGKVSFEWSGKSQSSFTRPSGSV
jgi:hypothetical protein